jgi:hypothetical protein
MMITSKEDFIAWCEKHNLKTDEAAKVLGTSRANGFKFANGTRPVSQSVAYCAEALDLLAAKPRQTLIKERLAKVSK